MKTLIVFAKAPVKGMVKTRLMENTPLNEDSILLLYEAFLSDILAVAGRSSADRLILNFTPSEMEGEMRLKAEEVFGGKSFDMVAQSGESFHERIKTSFEQAKGTGSTSIVMIGSDSPTLKTSLIDSAFTALEKNGGAVLGPSGEGGMYLIGIDRSLEFDYREIFSGGAELINFSRAVESIDAPLGVPLTLLEEVTDVDIASDLVTLVSLVESMKSARFTGDGFPARTAEVIGRLRLRVSRREDGTRGKVLTMEPAEVN
jgi:hypothetical protein